MTPLNVDLSGGEMSCRVVASQHLLSLFSLLPPPSPFTRVRLRARGCMDGVRGNDYAQWAVLHCLVRYLMLDLSFFPPVL